MNPAVADQIADAIEFAESTPREAHVCHTQYPYPIETGAHMSHQLTYVVLVNGEPKRAGDTLVFAKQAAQSYLRPGNPVSIRCPSQSSDARALPVMIAYDYDSQTWIKSK